MKLITCRLICLLLFILCPITGHTEPVGEIVSLKGRVDITQPGTPAQTASPDDPLSVGDIVRTKSNAAAEIRFGDGSVMRLGPGARVEITEYLFENGRTRASLRLFRGKIRSIVSKARGFFGKANRFEVQTPSAVIGVRGTDFLTWHQAGISGAMFMEGKGYCHCLDRPDQIRDISAGQMMTVQNAFTPPVIRPITDMNIPGTAGDTAAEEPSETTDESGEEAPSDADTSTDRGAEAESDDPNPASEMPSDLPEDSESPFYSSGDTWAADGDMGDDLSENWFYGDDMFSEALWGDGEFSDDEAEAFYDAFWTEPEYLLPVSDLLFGFESCFSGNIYTGATDSDGGYRLGRTGFVDGVLEGFEVFWAANVESSVFSSLYGFYVNDSPGGGDFIWTADAFFSQNATDGGMTAADGSAYYGFLGGTKSSGYADFSEGQMLSLYISPFGEIGILKGNLWGKSEPEFNEFHASGEIYPVVLSWNPFIRPEDLYYFVCAETTDSSDAVTIRGDWLTAAGEYAGDLMTDDFQRGTLWIDGETWGISQFLASGRYTGTADLSAGRRRITVSDRTTRQSWLTEYDDDEDTLRMAWSDPKSGLTGVGGGDALWLHDADAQTWQAISMRTRIDTPAFLELTGDEYGLDTLSALNIPAVEIGRETLTGKSNRLRVQMSDVIFFRYRTGGPSAIWATGDITGEFSSAPGTGHTLKLEGGELKANFTVTDWEQEIWGAEINDGTGSITGADGEAVTASFSGFAAGQYDLSGYFSGTGAGLALTDTDFINPVAFQSDFSGGIYQGTFSESTGFVSGYLEGYDNLWDATPEIPSFFNISAMFGMFDAVPDKPVIWIADELVSFDSFEYTDTTPDGGAYKGFSGGFSFCDEEALVQGLTLSLFTDPDGNTGVLQGTFSGYYDFETDCISAWGNLYPIRLASHGPDADAFNTSVMVSVADHDMAGFEGAFIGDDGLLSGAVDVATLSRTDLRLPGESWGISQIISSGTFYAGNKEAGSDRWRISYHSPDTGQSHIREFEDTAWAENVISGTAGMSWADIDQALTGVGGGQFAGTFDPEQYTWQALEMWTTMTTGTFLEMTATPGGRDQLAALKIPSIEIGRASLTGGDDALSVRMNDVAFFSYRTGDAPRIWATGDVAGTYQRPPETGQSVNLSGNGLDARFEVTGWNAQTWGAAVSGSGPLQRSDTGGTATVQFTGHAAGTHSGTSDGAFTGTASGVATGP
ncbi:hypothetical protein DENIS_1051 [Desulfonema ishimotonii]|uniref:FecR protein domain-containing protein n=1 Tax=Desulfonema ishimotonii TaxID=45657 RepID=A0A401FT20_9BACT|nr:FecR domain-containing protein [Desulfonema ishimotonii]GBC60106.1 hypothetical protein DENIS_1051 [Desulfonema ishimotonii]